MLLSRFFWRLLRMLRSLNTPLFHKRLANVICYSDLLQSYQNHQPDEQHHDHTMSGNQSYQPHLGATFYPGGNDDFYMPEVISPSPQRVMPEVPGNMQENLAQLELESTPRRTSSLSHTSNAQHSST